MVEPLDRSIETPSTSLSSHTGEGIVIDIGTGDGLYVYDCARRNPSKFYIGIDANPRPLEKVSEKIHRNPKKGGAPNVAFVQASVEDLPGELDGIADEVHIHFPWGSLLGSLANGEMPVLNNIRRICSSGAILEMILGFDPIRDSTELERLGVQVLSTKFIDEVLVPRYIDAGFEILERGEIQPSAWPQLQTSWAKKLKGGGSRSLIYIIARTCDVPA